MKLKQITATGFVILACLASLVIGFGVEVAQAVTLGQVSRSDVGAAKGSWQIDTTNGTQFRITGLSRDYNPGGNSVCVKITNSTYRPGSGFVTATSIRWNDYTWKSYSVTLRAPWIDKSQLCEDIRYRVDPCS